MKINNKELSPRKMYILIKEDTSENNEIILRYRCEGELTNLAILFHNQIIIPYNDRDLAYSYRLLKFMDSIIQESRDTEKKDTKSYLFTREIIANPHIENIYIKGDELIVDVTPEEFNTKSTFVSLPTKHHINSQFFLDTVDKFKAMKTEYNKEQEDRTNIVNKISRNFNYGDGYKEIDRSQFVKLFKGESKQLEIPLDIEKLNKLKANLTRTYIKDKLNKECKCGDKCSKVKKEVENKTINTGDFSEYWRSVNAGIQYEYTGTGKEVSVKQMEFICPINGSKTIILPVLSKHSDEAKQIIADFNNGYLTEGAYQIIKL